MPEYNKPSLLFSEIVELLNTSKVERNNENTQQQQLHQRTQNIFR